MFLFLRSKKREQSNFGGFFDFLSEYGAEHTLKGYVSAERKKKIEKEPPQAIVKKLEKVSEPKVRARGQVMLLTVLIVSSTILSATMIAGILMRNQIRSATNIGQSLQALYAADAGIEFELYKLLKDDTIPDPSFTIPVSLKTQILTEGGDIELRSVGCSGPFTKAISTRSCPRAINRSFELFFEKI